MHPRVSPARNYIVLSSRRTHGCKLHIGEVSMYAHGLIDQCRNIEESKVNRLERMRGMDD